MIYIFRAKIFLKDYSNNWKNCTFPLSGLMFILERKKTGCYSLKQKKGNSSVEKDSIGRKNIYLLMIKIM